MDRNHRYANACFPMPNGPACKAKNVSMTKSLWCLLTICFGNLHAQSVQSAGTEKLDWKADHTYTVNLYDTAFGFYQCHLRSLSYIKENDIAWTIGLPERMQRYVAANIYNKSVSPEGNTPPRKIRFDEIDLNNHSPEFLKCPELILDDAIAISDASGFLLLDKKSGTVLADIPDKASEERFYVDSGRYDIRLRNVSCSGFTKHGAEFISSCAGYLFHFNGNELFVFDRNRRLADRIMYSAASHGKRSKGASHKNASFKGRRYNIEINGVVYLHH